MGKVHSNIWVHLYINYCNYLLKSWNKLYQYRSFKKPIQKDKKIYLFIYQKTDDNLFDFFKKVTYLNYPKELIDIVVYLKTPLKPQLMGYNKSTIRLINGQTEHEIRDQSILECINGDYDYYLNIDTICMLDYLDIIDCLMEYDKLIISPYLISNCRYLPTCSEYFIDSLKINGAIKGSYLGIKRILSFSCCINRLSLSGPISSFTNSFNSGSLSFNISSSSLI